MISFSLSDQLYAIGLDSVTPEIIPEALDCKPIYVDDDYAQFELRLKALMESLDIQSAIKAS